MFNFIIDKLFLIIKRFIFSILLIYIYNVIFYSVFNIIPMNFFLILLIMILGFPGIIGISLFSILFL